MQCTHVPYGVIRAVRNAGLVLIASAGATFANPVTIAAFGDSLTQGFGLVADDGFVPQLETWLTDQGAEVTLINAGVSGDTTAGGLSRIEWTLTPDIDAIIIALGGNDLLLLSWTFLCSLSVYLDFYWYLKRLSNSYE